ncbi:hypothetical protein [Cellulomonas sp. URHB0016]
MPSQTRIMRSDAPEREGLARDGWVVVARSWAGALDAEACDEHVLRNLVARAEPVGVVRRLSVGDVVGVLSLDAATLHD